MTQREPAAHQGEEPGLRELLDEQIRYYRARAGEYDATSSPDGDPFAVDAERMRAALRSLEPHGRILELAAGTGQWTGMLAEAASELKATDASPEMLRINATRTANPRVVYEIADIFSLQPDGSWDVVFFGFWLSHVPPGSFEAFWDLVAGLLAPGGRAMFVDEGRHRHWKEDWLNRSRGLVRRRLRSGETYRAVKILWDGDDLAARLSNLGWDARIETVGPFYWGVTEPSAATPG
jgi:demethylmenaquinone methyltransferase/2-methoxy-6-polyprenyl-1,4-benzoquinol methylase